MAICIYLLKTLVVQTLETLASVPRVVYTQLIRGMGVWGRDGKNIGILQEVVTVEMISQTMPYGLNGGKRCEIP